MENCNCECHEINPGENTYCTGCEENHLND